MPKTRVYMSEKWMKYQYHTLRLNEQEIADKAGCTLSTVYIWLKTFGLKK